MARTKKRFVSSAGAEIGRRRLHRRLRHLLEQLPAVGRRRDAHLGVRAERRRGEQAGQAVAQSARTKRANVGHGLGSTTSTNRAGARHGCSVRAAFSLRAGALLR
jgi:hypothetical protein